MLDVVLEENIEWATLEQPKAKDMNSYDLKAELWMSDDIKLHMKCKDMNLDAFCSFDDCP